MIRLGLHFPGDSAKAEFLGEIYNVETGMEYYLYADCDGDLIMSAGLGGTGVADWFWVTEAEWDVLGDAAEVARGAMRWDDYEV